jgi:thiamine-phosphate pyrophosphorylase
LKSDPHHVHGPVDLRVYLVTDRGATGGRPLADVVEACLEAGVRTVQLREKDLGGRDLYHLADDLRARTARHGARLLVNDRVDVALAVGADGVHLPGTGFPIETARGLLGAGRLVAVSTHSPPDAAAAARAGADFVVFGPVYETPSKRGYGPPVGLAALAEACRSATVPVVAIGGVTAARVPEARRAGAAGVAVIRALLEAVDPARAVREMLGAWP